jgi:predicted RNase H-like HicB family nuclease
MTVWTVRAEYDPEAAVWWAADSDVPGLAADAATLEELAGKIGAMLSDLLQLNAEQLTDPSRLKGPHRLRIIAHLERLFDVAA